MTEKQRRGFALLSPERMKQIASKGGTTAHSAGKAHTFTKQEAIAAARKSVAARRAKTASK